MTSGAILVCSPKMHSNQHQTVMTFNFKSVVSSYFSGIFLSYGAVNKHINSSIYTHCDFSVLTFIMTFLHPDSHSSVLQQKESENYSFYRKRKAHKNIIKVSVKAELNLL